ncbi:MAG: SGNH/GDSL hydrolase family protein [Candidatus Methylacidiphilales bacterium]|nr:SGNH/GDSL hydrolase family protein [Candidatus Methylacidiphilales bacterium]
MPNFFAKLEAGGPVRIAYLGGSITEAWGWRDLSRDWVAQQYPQAKVSQIRATISGTGAEFGACRLKEHVLHHGPDLVFVEFAVNGAGATDQRAVESVEGIVRQIRRHDPKAEVCLVFTVSSGMLKILKEGRSPQVVENMKKVADHYGVPTIDFGPGIVSLVDEGKLIFSGPAPAKDAPVGGPMVFSTDGTHPLFETGHKLYLEAIVRSMPAIRAAGLPGPHPLPEPLEKDNWENGSMVAIDASGVQRSAGWQKIEPPDGTEQRQRISEYFPGVWETSQAGDTIEFSFEGTGFGLSGFRGMAAGLFRVTVDDRPPLNATFFDSYSYAGRVSHKAWFYPESLSRGPHRVKIEFLSELPDHAAILKKEGKNYKQPDLAPKPVLQLAAILLAGSLVH